MSAAANQQLESSSQPAILDWMDAMRQSARSAPWAELMNFDGVDALDVLLSPIYVSVLNALHDSAKQSPGGSSGWIAHGRNLAYRAKTLVRDRAAARKSAEPALTDVLFWSRDPTHTTVFVPVAGALLSKEIQRGYSPARRTFFKD